MKRAIGVAVAILLILDAVVSVYAALKAPYPAAVPLGSPMAYRNIYLHVPIAWTTYMLFMIGFILAILYLVTQKEVFDKYSALFIYAGIIYAFMVLATGSAWAAESWGSFWNWDPRETGVLILFIAYLVYVALRHSIRDPKKRATVSAVYAVAAFATVPVSFMMPYIAKGSLHPTMKSTESFISQPSVRTLFFSKVMLTTLVGILIPIAVGVGAKKELLLGAGVAALILFIGAVLAFPWGASGRVVRVEIAKGNAELYAYVGKGYQEIRGSLIVYVNEGGQLKKVHVTNMQGIPKPEFVEVPSFARNSNLSVVYKGEKLWPTLLGHIVKIERNRVVALNPFCIPWTLFIYGVGLLMLAYILPRAF